MPKGQPGRAVCSVEWCERLVHGRGLCETHYRQVRSTGEISTAWHEENGVAVAACADCSARVELTANAKRRARWILCQECRRRKDREKAARERAANPEKVKRRQRESEARRRSDPVIGEKIRADSRRRRLEKNYGVTLAQYQAMLEAQMGACAICLQSSSRGPLVVDHNHETGEVRGLLCHQCNQALGLFRDLPYRLRNAIEYLETRGARQIHYMTMRVISAS